MKRIAALAALVLGTASLNAEEARLLRFPTTNGDVVVFSYAGDLYKAPLGGGEASRLTSHNGYEMFARFSPDGKTIAFTGQFDGNTEVYSIPVNGGEPKRLTWTSTRPSAFDFTSTISSPHTAALAGLVPWALSGTIIRVRFKSPRDM